MTDLQFIIDPDWKAIKVELLAAYGDRMAAADEDEHEAASDRFWAVVEAISAAPANSPEGLAVKARAMRMVWAQELTVDDSATDLWRSLLDDLDEGDHG
jgi:hypothetical protein